VDSAPADGCLAVRVAYNWAAYPANIREAADDLMPPELSVVIPVRNESANVRELHLEFTEVLTGWGRPYELIFIEDGSTDETFDRLADIQRRDARVRVIRFRRNFGQTAGFAAGFAHARGRYIATADGDLQNDPRDIPAMVDELERGRFDIVCGWRKHRKDPFFSRRVPSTIANRIISWATGVHLKDYGCSLKVFRADVVKPLRLYGEMHRFLPAIASEMGVRISERVVNHRGRKHGASKYGISRTVRVLLDLMTVKFLISYSTRPLQIFGLLGLGMGAAGVAVLAYLGYLKYVAHQGIGERLWLPFGILLIFTGVQLVTLGLLAEMQARTYHESQDKPVYVIRDILETAETRQPVNPYI
jgi:glycosyltransferase involved in cell wall biosynthesis